MSSPGDARAAREVEIDSRAGRDGELLGHEPGLVGRGVRRDDQQQGGKG